MLMYYQNILFMYTVALFMYSVKDFVNFIYIICRQSTALDILYQIVL